MIAAIQIVLGIISMLIFLYSMFMLKGNSNQHFILYTIYLFPFMNIDIIPGVYSMSIFELSTILFAVAFYTPKKHDLKPIGLMHLAIIAFCISILAGCYFAEDFGENSIKAIIQIGAVLFYAKIVFDELYIDHVFNEKILKGLRVCLVFSFIFMCTQLIFGSSISISKSENINVAGGEAFRYPSFFQDPQKYAQFLSMAGLLMMIPIANDKKWAYITKLLPYAAFAAILMTGSRAAMGGMIAGFMYIYWRTGKSVTFLFSMLMIGFVLLNVGEDLPIFKRASLTDSYDFRNDIWKEALGIYKLHPIWGIGAGNYADYVKIHHPDQFWMGDNEMTFFDHPESGYLKWLIEYGTLGFAAILSLICIPLYRCLFSNNNKTSLVSSAVLISWLIGFYTLYSIGDLRIGIMVTLAICLLVTENERTRAAFYRSRKHSF